MPITFRVIRELAASPSEVFHALSSPDEAADWMPGLVRLERLGSHGPVTVGSRWRETRRMLGKEASEEFEVTEFAPPTRIAFRVDGTRGSSGAGEYRYTYSLAPTVIGTLVTLDAEIHGLTGVMGAMGRVFSGVFKRACTKDLDALGSFLRGRPPMPGGSYPAPVVSSGSQASAM